MPSRSGRSQSESSPSWMSSSARSVVGVTSAGPSLALFAALMQRDREGGMTERERLRKTIRDLHGVESTHLRAVRAQETFQGNTLARRRRGLPDGRKPPGGPPP